jgi:hypothetical protein
VSSDAKHVTPIGEFYELHIGSPHRVKIKSIDRLRRAQDAEADRKDSVCKLRGIARKRSVIDDSMTDC